MFTSSVILLVLGWQTADVGLARADLPAYAAALDNIATGTPVYFGNLWKEAEKFRGLTVRVEGRVVRVFQTGAIGLLPARTEVWLALKTGNLICCVYPTLPGDAAQAGRALTVRFDGTSLGKVAYGSGDVLRLAPLIVGGKPPEDVGAVAPAARSRFATDRSDWIVAVVVGVMAVGVLVQKTRSDRPKFVADRGETPEFFDGGD